MSIQERTAALNFFNENRHFLSAPQNKWKQSLADAVKALMNVDSGRTPNQICKSWKDWRHRVVEKYNNFQNELKAHGVSNRSFSPIEYRLLSIVHETSLPNVPEGRLPEQYPQDIYKYSRSMERPDFQSNEIRPSTFDRLDQRYQRDHLDQTRISRPDQRVQTRSPRADLRDHPDQTSIASSDQQVQTRSPRADQREQQETPPLVLTGMTPASSSQSGSLLNCYPPATTPSVTSRFNLKKILMMRHMNSDQHGNINTPTPTAHHQPTENITPAPLTSPTNPFLSFQMLDEGKENEEIIEKGSTLNDDEFQNTHSRREERYTFDEVFEHNLGNNLNVMGERSSNDIQSRYCTSEKHTTPTSNVGLRLPIKMPFKLPRNGKRGSSGKTVMTIDTNTEQFQNEILNIKRAKLKLQEEELQLKKEELTILHDDKIQQRTSLRNIENYLRMIATASQNEK